MKRGSNKLLILFFLVFCTFTYVLVLLANKEAIISEDASNVDVEFNNFLADYWDKQLDSFPLYSSSLGYSKYDRKISSNSIRAHNELLEISKKDLNKLLEFDVTLLNDDNQLNFKLLKTHLENDIGVSSNPTYFLDLNQRGGIQNFYDSASRLSFETYEDYENWLFRLNLFADNITNSLNNNRLGLEKGITQPRHIIQKVVEQLKNLLDLGVENSPFLNIFKDSTSLTLDEKEYLLNEAKILIADTLNPSYEELYNFLNDEYLPNTRVSIGLQDIPGGKEWYESLVKYHTTTDLTPDEIHDIGLAEIARIRSEMETVIESVGYEGDFKSFLDFLRNDQRFYYDDPNDLLNAYLVMSKKIDPLLTKIFKKFPRAPYGVIPIPDDIAPYTTTAYYYSPSEDRPGYFYANLYKPESRPKYEIPVLTIHEAVPGHHFQISLAQELENVPDFRKHQSFTVFVEGWGLYSEELGEFLNLYDDPYDKFGQLTYDMWRAIRLVVDTGMHYKDWSRQDAIDLFVNNTAKSLLDIENEVDRYLIMPGQALAYKIGQMKIKELRIKASNELGDNYDIKEYHYEVLKRGALPLDVFEGYINEWIESKKSS